VVVVKVLFALEHFELDLTGFDAEQAAEPPTGDGHLFDQVGFDGGLGLELVAVIG